jgi:hypothetical protein
MSQTMHREDSEDHHHQGTPEHRHHRSHRHHKRSKKSTQVFSFVLFLWSLFTLGSILVLFDNIQSAPVWEVISLVSFSVFGLFFCVRLILRSKK